MKQLILLFFVCFTGISLNAQAWLRYEADVLPASTSGEAFDLSGVSQSAPGPNFEEAIIVDSDIAGNNILRYVQPDGTLMYQFKFQDASGADIDNAQFTLVSRVKGLEEWEALGLNRVFDFQLRNGVVNSRDELRLGYATNRIELDRADVFVDSTLNLTKWHIFRMTADGDLFSVYVDENPVPVLSMVSTVTTGDRYLKIGDGSSDAVGGLVDWVAFDTTGAYSPEDAPLDDSFTGYPIVPSATVSLQAQKFQLEISPNPFVNQLNVSFNLEQASDVQAWVIDLSGRIVKKVYDQKLGAGKQSIAISGNDLVSGSYLVKLQVGTDIATTIMVKAN